MRVGFRDWGGEQTAWVQRPQHAWVQRAHALHCCTHALRFWAALGLCSMECGLQPAHAAAAAAACVVCRDVYEGTIRELALGVAQGLNGTVFAYGATGSGKTHTMVGELQPYRLYRRL